MKSGRRHRQTIDENVGVAVGVIAKDGMPG
jgi:hypothetical protein